MWYFNCLFSAMYVLILGKDRYSPEKAAGQTNVLDVLQKTGVKVYWIDNNSSCKGVCKRTGHINIRSKPNQQSPFYTKYGELFDEELVVQVENVLAHYGKSWASIL